ncbi:ferroxidase fet3 [Coemansia sp. RSA 2336]|nr:ferroxidase fet3 [Coemansia sp. RSA 2336]
MYSIFIFTILSSIVCCSASVVEVYWNVSRVLASRDGRAPWQVIAVNGNPRIPPVHVQQGDILKLTVLNSMKNATSIHLRGFTFNGASYLDGTGMTSECGIPSGGTNYHTADGLRTPLIIHEPPSNSVIPYDKEILFTFEDWGEETELLPYYPDGLINGINGNVTQSIKLVPGKKYRMRFVNLGAVYFFKFRIPGHKMHVIEADSIGTEPLEVDGIDIGPGQRVSAILAVHNTDEFNYIYNVTMYASFIVPHDKLNPRHYEGVVEYNLHAPVKNFPSPDDSELQWQDDILLQPLNKQPLLSKVDHSIVLKERTFTTEYGFPHLALGNASYAPPLVPSLFSALSMGNLALDARIYGPQANAQILRHMEVVEITIHCPSKRDHSFHIHGHSAQIVEFGPSGDAVANGKAPVQLRRSTNSPMYRDVITVRAYSYVKLRFRADNPGVWRLGDDISAHTWGGLAITLVEAPDVLQKQQAIPQDLIDMCLAQGIKVTGNAAGNQGFNLTGLPPAVYMQDN